MLIDNFEDSREAGLLELDEHFGDVSIVATMRPDLDRFEFLEPPVNQSHIPYSISNNFNLIIPLFDIPNISEDEKKAKYFFNMWENDLFKDEIIQFLEFETEFTEDSKKALIEIYKTERDKFNVSLLDEVVDCDWQLPFVLKDLDTLKKMSIAVAKLNKSKEVTVEHVKEAVEIFDYFKKLYNKGISGANHSTKSSRVHNNQVFEEEIGILHNVLKELREKEGEHIVVERVFEELEKKNINKQVTEKLLLGLKKMGDIYEPKKGVLRML